MMNSYYTDTIAAISTPLGKGGIGVLRISGNLVPKIAPKLLGKIPEPRKAEYLPFLSENGSILDKVIALFFPEPCSFTGEHVLEIHGHGGYIILYVLLDRILKVSSGIRLANPGEFTERAFLNNKIDLIQAESIADIIDAMSYQAVQSASNSLQGAFSAKIRVILKKITNLRVCIETSIDFSDQEITTLEVNKIQNDLENIIQDISKIYKSAYYGFLFKEGIKIVIAGKPNAGKSSLFNALIGMNRAIISKISGTTRDTLCENIQLNGITCYITDTAGLKKDSTNEIECIGIQRMWDELIKSDHILWVVDSNDLIDKDHINILDSIKEIFLSIKKTIPLTIICNKSDLSLKKIGISTIDSYTCITLSALLNSGIDILKEHLFNIIKFQMQQKSGFDTIGEHESVFIARKRHLLILEKSIQYLKSAQTQFQCNMFINDIFAEDLRYAHDELNQILGKFTSDDLLKKIFSTFCIGK